MTVDSFDPQSLNQSISAAVLEEFLTASQNLEASGFGLDELSIKRLSAYARHSGAVDWSAAVESRSDDDLVNLIRFFTVAEQQLAGFEAGSKSPVIPLARALKARSAYPADLTPWIKANTDNRFLPHGSLMDRL